MFIGYVYEKVTGFERCIHTPALKCLGSERHPKLSTGFPHFGLPKSYFPF